MFFHTFGRRALALSAFVMIVQIPAGPSVRVSDGWYHLDDCSIAVGRQAPSMPLAEALRKSSTACPICEPLRHQPEWAAFVKSHGETIKAEVKARLEAEAAEAKRKADAEEADRLRRLKELEDERKKKESAPVVRLTEAQVREIGQSALTEAKGDAAAFQTRFRARVKELSPEYAGQQVAYSSAVLKIIVSGPIARFESLLVDRLQKRQATTAVPWAPEVAISVLPESIQAPDIKQVVVQRSDALRQIGAEQTATVLSSTLAPRRLPGAPVSAPSIHMGDVIVPLSVFAPGDGVTVRVIAVPTAGAPLSRTFQGFALRLIQ